jgi:hypothetical protein
MGRVFQESLCVGGQTERRPTLRRRARRGARPLAGEAPARRGAHHSAPRCRVGGGARPAQGGATRRAGRTCAQLSKPGGKRWGRGSMAAIGECGCGGRNMTHARRARCGTARAARHWPAGGRRRRARAPAPRRSARRRRAPLGVCSGGAVGSPQKREHFGVRPCAHLVATDAGTNSGVWQGKKIGKRACTGGRPVALAATANLPARQQRPLCDDGRRELKRWGLASPRALGAAGDDVLGLHRAVARRLDAALGARLVRELDGCGGHALGDLLLGVL